MKFSAKTSEFLGAVQLVSRAIGGDQVLPILHNIHLRAESGTCTLSATNLELSIVTSITVSIESEGILTIPAKALLNFLQYCQDADVVLESTEGTLVKVHSRRARASIAGEEAANFPTIATIEHQTHIDLPVAPLMEALSLVPFACAKTSSRPVIAGVCLQQVEGGFVLVSTDSYRLSEYRIDTPGISGNISIIIPARFLEELRNVISVARSTSQNAATTVTMYLTQQQIEVTVDTTRLISRLIEGKFPDYKQVILQKIGCTVSTSAQDILSAVKRMHYFAKEQSNTITFAFRDSAVHLTTRQTQLGRDESVIPAAIEGSEAKIAISSTYLIDILGRIAGDTIIFKLLDHVHPVILQIPGNTRFLHLIMPLRMTEE